MVTSACGPHEGQALSRRLSGTAGSFRGKEFAGYNSRFGPVWPAYTDAGGVIEANGEGVDLANGY
ncbi:hypothetical protein JG536_04020 [Burkholderia ambifaria]|uniref:hypothetical protein n=1 Tax=Burkholderia ambifaria TaxID=152480 RepID=UPI00158B5D3D|nr:hypothetical protein [Burkholderia ambifaria]QQJ97845.1 hypothetical protein JG536_04020 [Burkholderia ambifaria]